MDWQEWGERKGKERITKGRKAKEETTRKEEPEDMLQRVQSRWWTTSSVPVPPPPALQSHYKPTCTHAIQKVKTTAKLTSLETRLIWVTKTSYVDTQIKTSQIQNSVKIKWCSLWHDHPVCQNTPLAVCIHFIWWNKSWWTGQKMLTER